MLARTFCISHIASIAPLSSLPRLSALPGCARCMLDEEPAYHVDVIGGVPARTPVTSEAAARLCGTPPVARTARASAERAERADTPAAERYLRTRHEACLRG